MTNKTNTASATEIYTQYEMEVDQFFNQDDSKTAESAIQMKQMSRAENRRTRKRAMRKNTSTLQVFQKKRQKEEKEAEEKQRLFFSEAKSLMGKVANMAKRCKRKAKVKTK